MLDITKPAIFVDNNVAIHQFIEQGQDLNLRSSGYKPNIPDGSQPNIKMTDRWSTPQADLISNANVVDRPRAQTLYTNRKSSKSW